MTKPSETILLAFASVSNPSLRLLVPQPSPINPAWCLRVQLSSASVSDLIFKSVMAS